jgi:serine/threonine protein kinase
MQTDLTQAPISKQCPARKELFALLDDQSDEPVESAIAAHLSHCADCRKALEGAAGEPSWWNEAQTFLAAVHTLTNLPASWPHHADSSSAPMPPASATKLAASSTSRKLDASDTDDEDENHDAEIAAEITGWLGPTDDPESLGRIGRYEVMGIVGAGSMGVVLKALEPQLKRYVAVKVLLPLLAHNGPARRRFDREARSAAAVNHPHVVPIYGVDEYRGLPYLVMQYVPGQSLAQRIEGSGPLATTEVVRIALQTARALAAAHEQGLVHRDIKPANILLENGVERVLVTDFGLARIADDASMTRSGVITGTPQFMSPEQASGRDVDARSDLFSLGAVMYAMCTGHGPFRSSSVFGLLKRICEDEPRSIREVSPEIPEWLEQFIFKLLAKDPAGRFASAEEVAEQLTAELAYLQNPTGVREPDRPWLPRRELPMRDRIGHATSAASIAGIAACVVLLSAPPNVATHPGNTAQATAAAEIQGDENAGPLQQVAAKVELLEGDYWDTQPSAAIDPWRAEADALRALLSELEERHSKPLFD